MKSIGLRVFLVISIIYFTTFNDIYVSAVPMQQGYSMPSTSAIPLYLNYGRFDNLWNKASTITLTTTTGVVNNIATRTLVARESGALVIVSSTTGYTLTLPAPTTGMNFEVVSSASPTTGTAKITTDAATTFIAGGITVMQSSGTAATSTFTCNGTSHISISQNLTTSGGLIGTRLKFHAVSTTLWNVQGITVGTGMTGSVPAVTPCST